MNWIDALAKHQQNNHSFVLVTVLKNEGSTPRDCDAKMVVTLDESADSIGGGQLEFRAIEMAHELLLKNDSGSSIQDYNLSQDLEQCCGGRVTLLYECFVTKQMEVVLFGAGHVGSALVRVLSELPYRVRWFDSRPDCFGVNLPSHIQTSVMESPEQAVELCTAGSHYLVMTHSHSLDQQLLEAILARGDSHFCGLIGSKSKAASFRSRLKRKGFTDEELAQLSSPIGLQSVKGKAPMQIAVSVAAQLLSLRSE